MTEYHNKINNGKFHICVDCGRMFSCPYQQHGQEIEGWKIKHHRRGYKGYQYETIKVKHCPLFEDSTDCKDCEGCDEQRYFGGSNILCEQKKERRVRREAHR